MSEDKPKVVGKTIRLAGDVDNCGHCLLGTTILLGDNKQISQLVEGNEVISKEGLEKISKVFKHEHQGKLLTIKGSGIIPIEITPEHPLLVTTATTYKQNNNKRKIKSFSEAVFKKASEVKPYTTDGGDFLLLPKLEGKISIDEISLAEFSKYKLGNYSTISLKQDLAWLMGLYVAEGVSGHKIRFCLGKHEKDLIQKAFKIIASLGYTPRVYDTRTTTIVELQSRLMARMFAQLCGKGARNKKIPDIILLHKDNKILESFIDGYWQGDGDEFVVKKIGKTKFQRVTTRSKILILQLQIAYARLGYFMAVYVSNNKPFSVIEGRTVRQLISYTGIVSKSRMAHRNPLKGKYFLIPITKVEERDFNGEVFNIETTDTHTYLVHNVITHNCKEGDNFFKETAKTAGANYEYYHIESDKGKQIADNLEGGPEGSIPIPAIEYCKTVENNGEKEEKCDYVEGFSKGDWDSNLNYKKPNNVDEEIDELFGDNN